MRMIRSATLRLRGRILSSMAIPSPGEGRAAGMIATRRNRDHARKLLMPPVYSANLFWAAANAVGGSRTAVAGRERRSDGRGICQAFSDSRASRHRVAFLPSRAQEERDMSTVLARAPIVVTHESG